MKIACEAVIPVLAILLAFTSWRDWKRVLPPLLLGLGWFLLWQNLDRAFEIWWPNDFSSHSAVAIVVGCSLAARGARWAAVTIALWLAYAWMMRELGYHTIVDMVTTLGIMLPFMVGVLWLNGRRGIARPTPSQG